MSQSGVRGEGTPGGIGGRPLRDARDLGWDDRLPSPKGPPEQHAGPYEDEDGARPGPGAGRNRSVTGGRSVGRARGAAMGTPPAARKATDPPTASPTAAPTDSPTDSPTGADGARTVTGLREAAGVAARPARMTAARPRRGLRVLRWFTTFLAVVILGTAGAGYLYYRHLNGNLRTDPLNIGDHKAPQPNPNAAGQTPLNILLIGSDARDSKANQDLGGARGTFGGAPRADVQMLVHLSADRSNMSVVSMPRDTLVPIPQCTDAKTGTVYPALTTPTIVNSSLSRGGPGCTVATWEQLTGIHIDHFMMVDFAGVVAMADAIGGVPVCVDANIYSHSSDGHGSGLKLAEGTHYVKGVQALQWLRTRYGFEDGSDIGRTKAQHMYMNAMVRELRRNATLSSPGRLRSIAEEATRALRVDEGLNDVMKLYDLSNELKKVSAERITSTTMPYDYVGARVQPKAGDADQLFRMVRDDVPLDGRKSKGTGQGTARPTEPVSSDPADPDAAIAVRVQNGTRTPALAPVTGRAGAVVQLLVGKGFGRALADQTVVLAQQRTVIRYPSADLEGDAQRVARSLGIPLSSVNRSTAVTGVTLVVGADWREGTVYQSSSTPEDTKAPDSADPLNGADASACMHVNPAFTW